MRPKSVGVGLELLPGRARILYQPVGVVGIISPWNYPFQLAIMPLIAALAAGNRVMLKPSELTPRTSEFLAEFLGKLFPEEKVATVLGGPDVGAAFSSLPFDHLFYTGSTEVGRRVMRAAAENLTPVTLELGGKSPCIIGADAVLTTAADSIASGKLLNAGQTCIAPDYVLVAESLAGGSGRGATKPVKRFIRRCARIPDYTSIVNARHYGRIARYIEEARQKGAPVVEINPAGEPLDPAERKIAPTLLIDPADDLAVMREEIFGPRAADQVLQTRRRRHRLRQRPPAAARALLFRRRQGPARSRARRHDLGRRLGQRHADACRRRRTCRSAASARRASAPITANTASRPFRTGRACSCKAAYNAAHLIRPPFGRVADLMRKIMMGR